MINFDAIPSELKKLNQWIVWREEIRNGISNKTPYQMNGIEAESDNPATWVSFDEIAKFDANKFSGIGFVFDSGYFGIDLDACIYPDGKLTAWSEEILKACPSYCEISPSGIGLKIIGRGDIGLPPEKTGKTFRKGLKAVSDKKNPEIAIWQRKRYFAMTGKVFRGMAEIKDCEIRKLWDRLFPDKKQSFSAGAVGQSDRIKKAVASMCGMNMQDANDGSRRLFAAACRCVGFDLNPAESLTAIRSYSMLQPFPRDWSDDEVLSRVSDAENETPRGSELIKQSYQRQSQEPVADNKVVEQEATTFKGIAKKYIDSFGVDRVPLVSAGLDTLNYALGGGFQFGEVVVVAARPSNGKTAVAFQFLHSMTASGLVGMYVNEEMSEDAIGERIVQYFTTIHAKDRFTCKKEVQEQVEIAMQSRKDVIVVSNARTVENVEALIKKHVAENKVSIVVVDYLQRLNATGKKSDLESVTYASKQLSSLAKELNVILILLCQLNRGIEDRMQQKKSANAMPMMSDLRSSGQIEQDADVILFLTWPKQMNKESDSPADQYFIKVEKNRNRGIRQSVVECCFDPERQMVTPQKITESQKEISENKTSFSKDFADYGNGYKVNF